MDPMLQHLLQANLQQPRFRHHSCHCCSSPWSLLGCRVPSYKVEQRGWHWGISANVCKDSPLGRMEEWAKLDWACILLPLPGFSLAPCNKGWQWSLLVIPSSKTQLLIHRPTHTGLGASLGSTVCYRRYMTGSGPAWMQGSRPSASSVLHKPCTLCQLRYNSSLLWVHLLWPLF